jgi:hypothetical protein
MHRRVFSHPFFKEPVSSPISASLAPVVSTTKSPMSSRTLPSSQSAAFSRRWKLSGHSWPTCRAIVQPFPGVGGVSERVSAGEDPAKLDASPVH